MMVSAVVRKKRITDLKLELSYVDAKGAIPEKLLSRPRVRQIEVATTSATVET